MSVSCKTPRTGNASAVSEQISSAWELLHAGRMRAAYIVMKPVLEYFRQNAHEFSETHRVSVRAFVARMQDLQKECAAAVAAVQSRTPNQKEVYAFGARRSISHAVLLICENISEKIEP